MKKLKNILIVIDMGEIRNRVIARTALHGGRNQRMG